MGKPAIVALSRMPGYEAPMGPVTMHIKTALDTVLHVLNTATDNDVDAIRLYLYNKYSNRDTLLGEVVINDIRHALDEEAVKRAKKRK